MLEEIEKSSGKLHTRRRTAGSIISIQGRERRKVMFGEVHVMEFPIELGDSNSSDYPLTIGWVLLKKSKYDLNSYERMRPVSQRRRPKQLRIPTAKRAQILLDQGYTIPVRQIAVIALKSKDRRLRKQNQKFDRLYEALAMAGRRKALDSQLPSLFSIQRTSKESLSDFETSPLNMLLHSGDEQTARSA
jgi:hypothetical protein